MSYSFDGNSGLIIVQARIFGPTGHLILNLALDTGATCSLVNVGSLTMIGYDPSLIPDRVQLTTGSGVEFSARVPLLRLECLDRSVNDFAVLAHTLPPSASIDGLLGLDFFRRSKLEIDFRAGTLTLD